MEHLFFKYLLCVGDRDQQDDDDGRGGDESVGI